MSPRDIATLREAADLIDQEAAIYLASNLGDGGDWIDEEDEQHYKRLVAVSARLHAIAGAHETAAFTRQGPLVRSQYHPPNQAVTRADFRGTGQTGPHQATFQGSQATKCATAVSGKTRAAPPRAGAERKGET